MSNCSLIEANFAAAAPGPDAFRIPDVRELRRDPSTVEFEVAGEIGPLLKALAPFRVLDLRTEASSVSAARWDMGTPSARNSGSSAPAPTPMTVRPFEK